MLKRRKRTEEYRQKSFLPLPPIWENDCVHVIRDEPSYGTPPSANSHHPTCFEDIFESFFQVLVIFNSEITQTKCIRNALLIYLALAKLNLLRSEYSRIIMFAIYYPTIVGWMYIITKCQVIYKGLFTYSLTKSSSNQTLSTVSSDDDIPSTDSDSQTNETNESPSMKETAGDFILNRVKKCSESSEAIRGSSNETYETSCINGQLNNSNFDIDDDYGHFVTFSDVDPSCQTFIGTKIQNEGAHKRLCMNAI